MGLNRTILCVTALVAGLASSAFAQRDFSKIQIKTTHVAGSVHMLEGSGGNIGVSAGEDGILIIDDQFAPLADKIKAAIAKIKPGKAAFLINTHYHGDHVGGNPEFGRDTTIIAHTNVRERLMTAQTLFRRTTQPMVKHGLPVITFDKSLSIHFNGEEIQAIHFPHGHTDGDSVIFFPKSNVVHMGDHYFKDTFPFVDVDHGGNVVGYAKNVQAVIDRVPADVKVIPGHGTLSNIPELKKFHGMLVETTDIVRSKKAAGKSLAQIQKEGLPDKWASWGGGFISTDKWLEAVHKSLAK